jgi:hypothetical protein
MLVPLSIKRLPKCHRCSAVYDVLCGCVWESLAFFYLFFYLAPCAPCACVRIVDKRWGGSCDSVLKVLARTLPPSSLTGDLEGDRRAAASFVASATLALICSHRVPGWVALDC